MNKQSNEFSDVGRGGCWGRVMYLLPFGWSLERPCQLPRVETVAEKSGFGGPPMCNRHRLAIAAMLGGGIPKSKATQRWMRGWGHDDDLPRLLDEANGVKHHKPTKAELAFLDELARRRMEQCH